MKVCSKCKDEKELSEFSKNKDGKFGVGSICKVCKNKNRTNNKIKIDQWKLKNPNYHLEWRLNNPDYSKKWQQTKNEKTKNYYKQYYKNKKQNDCFYKLKCNIRTRISQTLSGYSKSTSTLKILGLKSFEEFKQYLELQFQEGMNWDNYGYGKNKWVIDHKIPISLALSEDEIYKLNYYTNLQPMWWVDNMVKSNNIV
jgi:hypothetical protein